ncbi:hypothetical protein ACFLSQ_00460 [Bacteroidota bacterium]
MFSIKKNLIAILLVLLTQFTFSNNNEVFAQADYGGAVEAIYSNLNIINNSIYKIKTQMKGLEGSLNKKLRMQDKSVDENKNKIINNIKDIDKLKTEMSSIDKAYQNLLEKYDELLVDYSDIDYKILKVDSSVIDINYEILDLKKKVLSLATHYFELKNQFSKIPEIMFCQDCLPKFSLSIFANKYFTFKNDDVSILPSLAFDAIYNYNNSFSVWLNYNSPYFITVTTDDNNKISDHWETNIVSCGFLYNMLNNKNINLRIGSGLFYGLAEFDNNLNSNIGFERENIKDVASVGISVRSEISYSEFYSKNPLEVFLGINTLFSYEKTVLDPGIKGSHDLGNTLFFISLGVRFNFWAI